MLTDQWIHLILAYARYRKLFFLQIEDAEILGRQWDEVFKNERINSTSQASSSTSSPD